MNITNEPNIKLIKTQIQENTLKSKSLTSILSEVTRVTARIKFLRTYIRRAYTKSVRTTNLHNVFNKQPLRPSFSIIEPYFDNFKKEDIFLESKFWADLSEMTGLTKNTCYSLWINNHDGGLIDAWPCDRNIKIESNTKDWLLEGLRNRRPPIKVLQEFMSNENAKNKMKWSAEEDKLLKNAAEQYGKGKWARIAKIVKTKNPKQCMHRFRNNIDVIKKGKWDIQEDERLLEAIKKYGAAHWCNISEDVLTRNDAQCRERYLNILDPTLKHSDWSEQEDESLCNLVREFGDKKWSLISSKIEGRTDAQCRRRYQNLMKKNSEKK